MSKFNVLNDIGLEKFLSEFYLSKSNINILMSSKYYINQEESTNRELKKGDVIEFDLSLLDKSYFDHYKYKLDIIYEDDYILAINKPVKMLVHPDGTRNDTLANAVSFYYHINNLDISARALHRLDYETSGLVLFSKDALSHSFINNQIENRTFLKEYIAILEGVLDSENGILNFPIGRNRHNSKKYMVSKTGKTAITNYQVIARSKNKTKVKINIETGRTHQIRVHFSYIKHPIVGDDLYGTKDKRMYLHASKLSFIHPNTKKQIVISSYPKEGEGKWNL